MDKGEEGCPGPTRGGNTIEFSAVVCCDADCCTRCACRCGGVPGQWTTQRQSQRFQRHRLRRLTTQAQRVGRQGRVQTCIQTLSGIHCRCHALHELHVSTRMTYFFLLSLSIGHHLNFCVTCSICFYTYFIS